MPRPILLLVLANLLGGATYPLQKLALTGLPPATLSTLRVLLGLGLVAAWTKARGQSLWPFPRREAGRLALVGTLGMALPLLLGIEGLRRSTATNASLLILLEPVSIVLFARILLGERMGARGVAGLGLGLLGAVLVVTEGFTAGTSLLGDELLVGNLLLALSGLLWGIYTPLLKPVADRDPGALSFAALLLAIPLMVPVALIESPSWSAGPDLGSALAATAALGVVGTFLGTVLWTAAMRHVSANAVAGFVFLQPVVSAAAGALFLGERITAQAAIGGAIVGVGVVVGLEPTRKGEEPAA